jgi:hypothetical protein
MAECSVLLKFQLTNVIRKREKDRRVRRGKERDRGEN